MLAEGTQILLLVAAAAAGAAVTAAIAVPLGLRAHARRTHANRPSRPAEVMQADLRRLHLEDTCGELGRGFNRLLAEVAELRREVNQRRAHDKSGSQREPDRGPEDPPSQKGDDRVR